jgi:hypothetical protein
MACILCTLGEFKCFLWWVLWTFLIPYKVICSLFAHLSANKGEAKIRKG